VRGGHDDQAAEEPVDVEPEDLAEHHRREEAGGPEGSGDEEVVAESRDEPGDEAPRLAEALDDEGIEAAGVHEHPGHLRVADGEQQEDRRDGNEREDGAAPVAERDRQGDDHDGHGEGSDGGQHEEDDAGHAELVGDEAAGGAGQGFCHDGSFSTGESSEFAGRGARHRRRRWLAGLSR
jgi:hypothetical protein